VAIRFSDGVTRCAWVRDEPLSIAYHDDEWGTPVHDDRRLFEFLVLEGAQAGLSWNTILRKREGYRRAFDGFEIEKVARYGARKIASLLHDEAIVRNRLKIESAVSNARAVLAVRKEHGSFDDVLWSFVGGKPIVGRWPSSKVTPARTPESDAMSRALGKLGFRFVGSTICYALMQACGLADDHERDCFRARRRRALRTRSG
jgi:DNA-3-methyladenine glycosylase I